MGLPNVAELDAMIAEATIDCYNESEQATGLLTMLDAHLACPFETTILGVRVHVESVDIDENDNIVALCVRGAQRQAISLADLPLPDPPPDGAEWIWAYRRWLHPG
ncbi:MAG: hypothetical protein ACR2MY_06660 [Candidatus Dormibacteria bacterium]